MFKRMNYKSITTAKKRGRTGICLFLTLIFLVSAFLPAVVSADATNPPEKTEATVKKVWEDANNRDGKRPDSLDVALSNGQVVTLSDSNQWTDTITGLPKFDNGDLIEYTWTEGGLPEGYMLTDTSVAGTVTTFTNSYTPEETEATVKKVWDDDDDRDRKRPDSLTVTLSNGDTVTLNNENGWSATIRGLFKYEDGELIEYSWTEGSLPEGYTLTDTSVNGTVTTLTNSYSPEKTAIAVTKIWDDYNNAGNTRPGSVQVQLKADGENYGYPVTLSSENNWSHTWKDLPKYRQGTEIKYSVVEITNPGNYQIGDPQTGGSGITITNVYDPTPISVDPPVRKIFLGKDDLYNNGMYTYTIENTEAPDGVPVPMPEHTSITNSPEYELSNKPGYYEFGEIQFIIPGTYKYTIRESGSVKNMVNDPDAETGKTLTFVVTDDGSGILSVSPTTDKVDLSFTNTYSSSGSINFEAVISLEQGDLKDGQFSFELLDNEGNLIGTINNSADGSAIFPGITYTQEDIGKTFIYTIRAVIPDDPDEQIIYDDTEYTVTVTVSADAEGTLVINSDHPDPFKFTNTQKNPLSLVFGGHKTLPKLPREGDLPFRFQLFEILEDGSENPAAVASCTGSADYQFPAITYTEPGTYQYVVREIPDNLPGVTYDKREYRFTVTVTENPDGELTAEISGDDPEHLNFINIYKEVHEKPPLTLLPKTGFSAVRRQSLPQQPKDIRYRQLGWNLEIPSLELMTNIVGVPEVEGEYPVTWLGGQAGLLEGYPMPGQGRTILTGHNHLNDTEAGPFAFLLYMNEGDRIFVRDPRGNLLVYSVYANEKIGNAEIEEMERISDEFENSITLITCEDEQENGEYINRRTIAARPLM